MIQVNELRIGNWIYVPVKDSMQDGTWKDGVNQVEVTSIDEFGELGTTAYFHMSMGCTGTTCKDAIPIELSPEILTEWCGFIEKHTPTFSGGFDFYMKFIEQPDTKGTYSTRKLTVSDKSNFVFLNDNFIARCDFLHQLQNLIFALIGTELEIKIPVKA